MSFNCQCGARMACIDTRTSGPDVRRRYSCTCGKRISTREVIVDFDEGPLPGGNPGRARAYVSVHRGPVAPEDLPEAPHNIVGRAALGQFIDCYCMNKPDLTACAESAFYWFNKVAASADCPHLHYPPTDNGVPK